MELSYQLHTIVHGLTLVHLEQGRGILAAEQ